LFTHLFTIGPISPWPDNVDRNKLVPIAEDAWRHTGLPADPHSFA
jgi:hypothetical protein